MRYTLGKKERLKSKKLIEKLYNEGTSIKVFPLRMVYLQTAHTSNYPAQVGFSVSKRNFKKAVDRNRMKRLLRESYRKEKYAVYTKVHQPFILMISYLAKDKWRYADIALKMKKLISNFITEIHKNEQ